jgi:hypothetical protein
MVAENSVVGMYTNLDAAEDAVRQLGQGGFPIQHVSIIAQDLGSEKKIHGFVTACDVAKSSAQTGAWVGGIFGVLVGAAFLWVPGVGPLVVAGSLASVLLGGLEGAVAGAATTGLLGWLMGLGISRKHILKYEQHVKAGKYLLLAHGSPDEVAKAKQILTATKPTELDVHGPTAA